MRRITPDISRPLGALALALALAAAPRAAADVVTLNGGEEVFGEVLAADETGVTLRTATGEVRFAPERVLDVGFIRSYGVPGEERPGQVSDPLLREALAAPPTEADYPNAAAVDLLDEADVTVHPDGSLVIAARKATFILKERGRDSANVGYGFKPDVETVDLLVARAITPSGILAADDRAVSLESSLGNLPTYDRARTLKAAIPGSNPGAILESVTRTTRRPPDAENPLQFSFLFRGREPKRLARVTLRRPAGFPLEIFLHTGECAIERADAEEGGLAVTRVVCRDVPGIPDEPLSPPVAFSAPRLEIAAPAAWADLARAYAATLETLLASLPGARETAERYAGGPLDGRTGAVALYDAFVRDVVAVEVPPSYYSWHPTRPAERLAEKMASPLDKTFLYWALARAAGLPARFCLARTLNAGPLEEGPPSLARFDAALVRFDWPGGQEFVCPAYENHRFGVLPEGLQGAGCLVAETGERLPLPADGPERSRLDRVSTARLLPDGALEVESVETWSGLYDAAVRPLKRANADELRQWLEKRLTAEHPKARLLDWKVEGLDDLSRDIVVRAAYRIDDYALFSGPYALLRPPGAARGAFDVGAPSRANALFWGAPEAETRRIAIALPAGFTPHHLPPARFTDRPGYAYHAACGYSAGTLSFEERFERAALVAPRGEYPAYKAFVEGAAAFSREWVVLERPGRRGAGR